LLVDRRPETIVELRAGTSTVVLAYVLRKIGRGRLFTFEDRLEYADRTEKRVAAHCLTDYVRICHAPLTEIDGRNVWYDPAVVLSALVGPIDVLVTDGPSAVHNPDARRPALPLLVNNLAPGALIIMDDAYREGERRAMQNWSGTFGIGFSVVESEKGLAVGIYGQG
jgi:predicted O-methyltransferase YrrM